MDQMARFLFEVGQLKRVARSGWWVAGITSPESVAAHSFRTAWIGYLLAREAGADPTRVLLLALLHDLPEARINDHHRVSQAYLKPKTAEPRVLADQVSALENAAELRALHAEYEAGATLESQVARDADRLECAFQAREYVSAGCGACQAWFENAAARLHTEAGRTLYRALAAADPTDWHRSLPGA
jgi:putative hydrolase of HD superfamily